MKRNGLRALALSAFLASCAPPTQEPADAAGGDAAAPDPDREALLAAVQAPDGATVLVLENEPSVGSAATGVSPLLASARPAILALVPEEDVLFEAEQLPIVALRLRSRAQLESLEALSEVARIELDRQHEATGIPSLEQIGQPAALARGADGRGLSVAVLDTGADFTHPDLGGCSAAGPSCPVAFAQDFAPSDGVRDDSGRHGSNVSAIVRMVAPSVRVLALDVFSGGTASSVDIIEAIDWVLANRDAYSIVAANLSLGYGGFTSPCSTDVLAVALQRLRTGQVVPVVATGNSGYLNAISSPACAPAAVSVGALDGSSRVASFSNSAAFVSVLAPGVSIPAGGVTMSGTSQATPHVAGALAAVRTAYPRDSVDALVARITATGIATTDTRNGIVRPRLSLDAATAGGATAPPPDVAPPEGTLQRTIRFMW